MYKKLLALSLALFLCVYPVFAVSDADNSYYSFEPVSYGSLGGRSLSTLAASSFAWTDTDHDYLNQIRLALTSKNTGTLLSYIVSIKDSVSKSYDKLFYIKQNTDYLENINNNGNSVVSLLRSHLDSFAKDSTLSKGLLNPDGYPRLANIDDKLAVVAKESTLSSGLLNPDGYPRLANISDILVWLHPRLRNWMAEDGYNTDDPNSPTLYHYVKNLSEVLASDQDRALAEANAANRQQVEQNFVSGSSGNTSLGASDFGDLSSVGGSVKDSISLNGQSSISGFTGGLSDSDAAGQGWFSASTRDALDTVSPSSSSSYSRRSPDDTYNMAGFAEHYSWLYGG